MIIVLIIIALLLLVSFTTTMIGPQIAQQTQTGMFAPPMPGMIAEDAGLGMQKEIAPAFDATSAVPDIDRGASDEIITTEQKIIKTGSLTLKVDSVDQSSAEVTNIATRYEGFVQTSNIYESPTGAKSGTVIIRVPGDKFETALQEIKTLATLVVSENVSGQDVTEEFVDLQARLNNKYEEEQQYIKILDRANTVEDILMVTERLSWVRAEIERLEGRIKYLENLTDMATITVFLTEEERIEIPIEKWRPYEVVRQALRALIGSLQGIANLLIWLLIFAIGLILPISLVILLIIYIVKKIKKKIYKE